MNPKYQLGQTIKHVNDPDADGGVITHISMDNNRVLYTISLKDWDPEKREVINAVKHIEESEAVEVAAEAIPAEPAPQPEGTVRMDITDNLQG